VDRLVSGLGAPPGTMVDDVATEAREQIRQRHVGPTRRLRAPASPSRGGGEAGELVAGDVARNRIGRAKGLTVAATSIGGGGLERDR